MTIETPLPPILAAPESTPVSKPEPPLTLTLEPSEKLPTNAVAKFLRDHVDGMTLSKQGKLLVNGQYYRADDKLGLFNRLYALMPKEQRRAFVRTFGEAVEIFRDPEYSADIDAALKAVLRGSVADFSKPAAPSSFDDVYFNESIETPLSKLKVILNLKNKKSSLLYDAAKDIVHDIDYEIITTRLKTILGEAYGDYIQTNSEDCFLVYRPGQPHRLKADRAKQCKLFNTWDEVEWRRGWEPDPDAKCPTEIEEFMRYVVPDDDSRRYVEAWLRDATFERAEPIMVLTGPPGTGKTVLARNFTSALVGKNNYRSASRGFNKSYFHAGITRCRIFFLDEMPLTLDSRETLKDYHNGIATIERKGVDVGDPEKIYASFVLANNMKTKINLEYTDRKFFVPVLTNTPILATWSRERVNSLVRMLNEDDDAIRAYASYLYFRYRSQEAVNFPKTPMFKELCIKSLHPFLHAFVHACQQMETIHGRTFTRGKKTALDAFALKDHIENYEAQFAEPLAELTIAADGSWSAKSKIFKPTLANTPATTDAPVYKNGNGNAVNVDDVPTTITQDDGEELAL